MKKLPKCKAAPFCTTFIASAALVTFSIHIANRALGNVLQSNFEGFVVVPSIVDPYPSYAIIIAEVFVKYISSNVVHSELNSTSRCRPPQFLAYV